jgi:hypothetical protein
MKTKHNKKRNTAFIFESLIREMTKAVISRDAQLKNTTLRLLKEHFRKGCTLERELQCYQALLQEGNLDQYTAEKTIQVAKKEHSQLDKKTIFQEQSRIIKKINKNIGPHVFTNFVPNYRAAATIAQIFGEKTSISHKIILEKQILDSLTVAKTKTKNNEEMKPMDNLVARSFAENYNSKYSALLPEQRSLLQKYIFAFGDNDVDFRIALKSELERIYEAVNNSLTSKEVSADAEMVDNTKRVIQEIESFRVATIGDKELKKILKLQNLVYEYKNDAS